MKEMVEITRPDGKKEMIPRRRVCYKLREATVEETGKKVLVARGAVYARDEKTGQLVRLDKEHIGKAMKKALRREKVLMLKNKELDSRLHGNDRKEEAAV